MDTFIEILVDNSNSMGIPKGLTRDSQGTLREPTSYLLPDGTTRMQLAKNILLKEVISTIDYASNIKVSLFHSLVNKGEFPKLIQPIIYDGRNINKIKEAINSIEIPFDTGGTPITDALLCCINRLKKYHNSDRKIILITDGEETGEKDYKLAAEEVLDDLGINCKIFVVGIFLNQKARDKAESLAEYTKGEYYHLETTDYNESRIQSKLASLKNTIITDTVNKISKNQQDISTKKEELKQSNESNESQDTELKMSVSENSKLLSLLSKQVSILHSELIKQVGNDDNDDFIIKEDSELNEKIRLASESYLFDILKKKYKSQVEWLNSSGESGKPFDFKIIDSIDNSIEYYIECKGTIGNEKVFYLTKSEWSLFLQNHSKIPSLFYIKCT